MKSSLLRKIALTILWVGSLIYAFGFAPPNQPDTFELIVRLSTGQFEGINPLIIALFNIMGVWPLIYSSLLLFDGRMQKVWAWPFLTASLGVGAFGLLPYLILREPNPSFTGQKSIALKLLDSRWLAGAIAIAAFALVIYGVTQGNWSDFVAQWQTNRFIHVMSLDFCLLCLLFPTLLGDDMARHGLGYSQGNTRWLFWAISLIPFLGSAVYLVLRPPLPDSPAPQTPAHPSLAATPPD
ncbi:DUF2834 domain-containing protein [Leptodesmis sichuanensis A121]|nr:DUF2834 domain-containing protein [Leptodesmis sichuanensis]UIE36705.1 DUF2834 domain-containing protein [Leptodesmis sichuanensis A121]